VSDLTLVIGNKNYSSWSLRGWLFLKHTGAPFREIRIPLDQADTKARIAQYSPAGRVPILIDGDVSVWDSLAICEHLSETVLGGKGWPSDVKARAEARSVSAEMHSGFQALRNELPMNCRARRKLVPSPAARADIARILSIWDTCRSRHAAAGPWLFGSFCVADAMYAPVAFRFQTYSVGMTGNAAAYAKALLAHPAMLEWLAAGQAESEVVAADEAGTPA
jgi:glutathione S-transferase